MTALDEYVRAAHEAAASAVILMVEDSPADRRLMREAMAATGLVDQLEVVTDGDQALAYVRGQPPYTEARRPTIILLDLNLPSLDGRQVLLTLKADPLLRAIPVLVLTTSGSQSDIAGAYADGANAYLRKPATFEALLHLVETLAAFWLGAVVFPAAPDNPAGSVGKHKD